MGNMPIYFLLFMIVVISLADEETEYTVEVNNVQVKVGDKEYDCIKHDTTFNCIPPEERIDESKRQDLPE